MIVISDTSVISNLHLVGLLDLLPKLFKSIVISQKVFDELLELERFGVDIQPIANASFIIVQMPANQQLVQEFLMTLDEGEAQAITLALEIKADLLLIDELKGRSLAAQFGLNITGLLGVLLRAKQNGHLQEIKPVLEMLKSKANFFVGEKLAAQILQLAGE